MNTANYFENFFKASYANTYFLALSIIHDEEVSKDIVADAYESLLTKTKTKAMTTEELRNYLFIMVRNKCTDYFRHFTIREQYADWALHSLPTTEDNYYEHERKIEEILSALQELTPRTRKIMEEHYLYGQKYTEVAHKLGISENAVKKHIVAGLKYLRKKFVKESFLWVIIWWSKAFLLQNH